MTQPVNPAGVATHKITFENGGPLDGAEWEVAVNLGVVHAMAYKRDDGTWGDIRELCREAGIPDGAPVSTFPPEIVARGVQVEYLVDRDRGIASFREPAEIRDDRAEEEIPPQFRPADPRAQAPTVLAEQAMTRGFDEIEPFEQCKHEPVCRSVSLHWARAGVQALADDGLRVVEPTHITDTATDAFARLLHQATDAELGDPSDPADFDSGQGEYVREQYRAIAERVLSLLDVDGRVIIIRPTADTAGADFAALADVLREVAGASLVLALPPDGSITLESVDRAAMLDAGWRAAAPDEPVLAEPDVRGYLDGMVRHWRDAKRRRQADGDVGGVNECAAYVDAYQSARVSLLGEPLPPEPVEEPEPAEAPPTGPVIREVGDSLSAAPPGETIAQRDMRERRERQAKAQQTFQTLWVGCDPPADGQAYAVTEEEWNADYTIRQIKAWRPVERGDEG